jgi:hypothetical protein
MPIGVSDWLGKRVEIMTAPIKGGPWSAVEIKLGFQFVSDPRLAKYPLPAVGDGHNMAYPFRIGADQIEITPEMARDMLKYRLIRREQTPRDLIHPEFTDNRQLVMKSVKHWETQCSKGKINPYVKDGLAFTPDGFILDGQHRLIGCALSGKPMRLPVDINTAWSTFRVTDSGTARRADQMLGPEYPQPKASSAAAKMIFPVLSGDEKTSYTVFSSTREDQLDLIQSWPFFRDKGTFALMVNAQRGSRIQLSHLVSVCAMAHAALTVLGDDYPGENGTIEIDSFLRGLCFTPGKPFVFEDWGTGADPRYMLREQSLRRGPATDKGAEFQRASISLVRRAMTLWLSRYDENREPPMSRIGVARGGLLHPVWRSDLVQTYALDRQRELNNKTKG